MIFSLLNLINDDIVAIIRFIGVALLVLLMLYQKVHVSKCGRGLYVELPYPKKNSGYIDTIKSLTSKDLPYNLLDWAKDIPGSTYQLRVPLLPYPMFVVTGDHEVCRKVLSDRSSPKTRGVETLRILHDGGDDLFTSEGTFWKHSRKGIAPAFSSNNVKNMNHIAIKKTEEFTKKLNELSMSGESFDVGHEMLHLTLSIISEAAYQYPISLNERIMFLEELDIVFTESRKGRIPLRWKFGSYIPEVRRAREGGKKLVAFALKILAAYRQLESPLKGTVIDLIACNKNYKDDKERASDILILLIAGHDTTAFSLAWTLLELAKNQSEQAKLQYELRCLPEEIRCSSSVLSCVLKESQRLRPVLPIGSCRIVMQDIVVKKKGIKEKDILIPKGSAVMCSTILLNYNPNYHMDPYSFKPSRWIDPSEDSLASLMPFSLGRRNCIGQPLAKAEMVNVLSKLCTDYDFHVHNEGKEALVLTHQLVGARLYASRIVKDPTG